MRLSIWFRVPVGELQQRMSASEFLELLAYDRHIHPIGDACDDARFAMLAQTVAASVGAKTRTSDFMIEWQRWSRRAVDESAIMSAMAAHRAIYGNCR